MLKVRLLSLLVASSFGSYAVTRWETQKCSDLWILLETGKVPDRSPLKGEYSVWLQVCMPWNVVNNLYQLSTSHDKSNVSWCLSFSVYNRRIKETKQDEIW